MPSNTKDAGKAAKAAVKKTKKGTTHLVLLLDESGSMGGNEEAVVSGVNEFLATFADQDAKVTLATFDSAGWGNTADRTRFKWQAVPVAVAQQITAADYKPRGGTPLYDAVADMVAFVDGVKKKKEGVYMVILTDGMENASVEHTSNTIASLLKSREGDGWGFLYLGANQNATNVAAGMGLVGAGKASVFTSSKTGSKSALSASRLYAGNYMAFEDKGEALAANAALASETRSSVDENVDDAKILRRTRRTLEGR